MFKKHQTLQSMRVLKRKISQEQLWCGMFSRLPFSLSCGLTGPGEKQTLPPKSKLSQEAAAAGGSPRTSRAEVGSRWGLRAPRTA